MVAPQKEEVLRVFDLEGQQQANGSNAVLSPVNIITKKQVVCLWRKASHIEMVKQVFELAVDVTQDVNRWNELQENWLLLEYVLSLVNQQSDLLLLQDVG